MMNCKLGMRVYYRFEKFRADNSGAEIAGSRQVVSAWSPNIILNQGLDYIASKPLNYAVARVRVGSGNSTPSATQTGLDNQIAVSSTQQAASTGAETSGTPYIWRRRTVRFDEGEAAGILAEVGVGWSDEVTDTFSRALILDTDGNPTTITVLADEYLDVVYELRIYPPSADAAGSLTIDGKTYDYICRPARIGSYSINNSYPGGWNAEYGASSLAPSISNYSVFDGEIGDSTGYPAGTAKSVANGSVTPAGYVQGSYQLTLEIEFGLNNGNLSDGIRSLLFATGWGLWQMEFSEQGTGDTIPKDDQKKLTFNITHSWGRATI
ncbi:hypothetical protein ACJJIF_06915 [Microbulbifer sp. SSSA002]|uniref:hypothetical protein n=1 Tax=Microbulbifer sp. SSSA002 TaxID=3243376 RepID=UPI00403A01B2